MVAASASLLRQRYLEMPRAQCASAEEAQVLQKEIFRLRGQQIENDRNRALLRTVLKNEPQTEKKDELMNESMELVLSNKLIGAQIRSHINKCRNLPLRRGRDPMSLGELYFNHKYSTLKSDVKSIQRLKSFGLTQIKQMRIVKKIQTHFDSVFCVKISDDQQWIATGSDDFLIKIFCAQTMELFGTLKGHKNCICDIGFLPGKPKSKYLASSSVDTDIRIWDIETTLCLHVFRFHQKQCGPLLMVPLSDEKVMLVTTSDDGCCCLWNIDDIIQAREQEALESDKDSLTVNDTSSRTSGDLAPTSLKDLYKLRNNGFPVPIVLPHEATDIIPQKPTISVDCVTTHPHKSLDFILTGAEDGFARIWCSGTLLHKKCRVTESQTDVSASFQNMLVKTNESFILGSKRLTLSFKAHEHPVTHVSWSPDGNRIMTGSHKEGAIAIWHWEGLLSENVNSAGVVHSNQINMFFTLPTELFISLKPSEAEIALYSRIPGLENHSRRTSKINRDKDIVMDACTWTADGSNCVTMQSIKPSQGSGVELENAQTGANSGGVLRFSSNNTASGFSTAFCDQVVCTWCPISGKLIHKVRKHRKAGYIVIAHPHLNIVCTVGHDSSIIFWDVAQGTEIYSLLVPSVFGVSAILDAAFSSDGNTLYLTDSLGRIIVVSSTWDCEVIGGSNEGLKFYFKHEYMGSYPEQYFNQDLGVVTLQNSHVDELVRSFETEQQQLNNTLSNLRIENQAENGSSIRHEEAEKLLQQRVKTQPFGPVINLQRRAYRHQPPERNKFLSFLSEGLDLEANFALISREVELLEKATLTRETNTMLIYTDDFKAIDEKMSAVNTEEEYLRQLLLNPDIQLQVESNRPPLSARAQRRDAQNTLSDRYAADDDFVEMPPLYRPTRRSARQRRSTRNEDTFTYDLPPASEEPSSTAVHSTYFTRANQRRTTRRAASRRGTTTVVGANDTHQVELDFGYSDGSGEEEPQDPEEILRDNRRRQRAERQLNRTSRRRSGLRTRASRMSEASSDDSVSSADETPDSSNSEAEKPPRSTRKRVLQQNEPVVVPKEEPKPDYDTLCDRTWLRSSFSGISSAQYVPQLGEKVVIAMEPLISYLLTLGFDTERYQSEEFISCTKDSPFLLCKVDHLEYQFPDKNLFKSAGRLNLIAKVTLQVIAVPKNNILFHDAVLEGSAALSEDTRLWAEVKSFATSFLNISVDLFPHDLEEFLIPKLTFEQSLYKKYEIVEGNEDLNAKAFYIPFCDPKTQIWTYHWCRIVDKRLQEPVSKKSIFRCLEIQYENKQKDTVSPWDLREMFTETAHKINSGDDLAHYNDFVIYRPYKDGLLAKLVELQDDEKSSLFWSKVDTNIVEDYLSCVKLPMELDLIQRRLANDYYRDKDALLFDADLILNNSEIFNGSEDETEITKLAVYVQTFLHEAVADVLVKGESWLVKNPIDLSIVEDKLVKKTRRLRRKLDMDLADVQQTSPIALDVRLTRNQLNQLSNRSPESHGPTISARSERGRKRILKQLQTIHTDNEDEDDDAESYNEPVSRSRRKRRPRRAARPAKRRRRKRKDSEDSSSPDTKFESEIEQHEANAVRRSTRVLRNTSVKEDVIPTQSRRSVRSTRNSTSYI